LLTGVVCEPEETMRMLAEGRSFEEIARALPAEIAYEQIRLVVAIRPPPAR
jgi:hypothetical protein